MNESRTAINGSGDVNGQGYDVSGKLSVILAGPPTIVSPFMTLAPGNPTGVEVVATLRDTTDLTGDLETLRPHLVLLSPEVRGYTPELVSQLTNWPRHPVAVVGLVPAAGTCGAEMAGQGAVAFYTTPVTPGIVEKFAQESPGFVDAARARWSKPLVDSGVDRQVLDAIRATPYRTGVITFWSIKGGDGKTSLAVNLACGLALLGGQRVLLVDNDLNMGRVQFHLNMPVTDSLMYLADDFLNAGNRLDLRALKRRVAQADRQLDPRTKVVESRLDVLFGIQKPGDAASEGLRGKQGRLFMEALLDLARRAYDFVVVDSGSNTQLGAHVAGLNRADLIMFITTSDRSSLQTNREAVDYLVREYQLDRSRLRLVLNRYDDRDLIDIRQVSEMLAMPIVAIVPEDTSRDMIVAVNKGEPFLLHHMRRSDGNPAAEKTQRGLLEMLEEVYPPMGKMIAERDGRKKRPGLFGKR